MKHFRTIVKAPMMQPQISWEDGIMAIGSCFTQSIGEAFQRRKFNIDINPFGIQYNPASIAMSLQRMLSATLYTEDDLIFHGEKWHSLDHHGDFSHADKDQCLLHINQRLELAHEHIRQAKFLLLTFGTNRFFWHKEQQKIVANCHKIPAAEFESQTMSVKDILAELESVISSIRQINPEIKVVFTISPVRYKADSVSENTLAKSTLALAIHQMQKRISGTYYFPAYEIQLDDLRDYRFYAEDMNHPSKDAIDYIWEECSSAMIHQDTRSAMQEAEAIARAAAHRPVDPHSPSHQKFCEQQLQKINVLEQRFPFLDFEMERGLFSKYIS